MVGGWGARNSLLPKRNQDFRRVKYYIGVRFRGLTEKTPFLCRYIEVLGQKIMNLLLLGWLFVENQYKYNNQLIM